MEAREGWLSFRLELIGWLDTFGGRTIEDLSQEFLCHIQLTKVPFFSVYESQVQGKVPTVELSISVWRERGPRLRRRASHKRGRKEHITCDFLWNKFDHCSLVPFCPLQNGTFWEWQQLKANFRVKWSTWIANIFGNICRPLFIKCHCQIEPSNSIREKGRDFRRP